MLEPPNTELADNAVKALAALAWTPTTSWERSVYRIARKEFRTAAAEGQVAFEVLSSCLSIPESSAAEEVSESESAEALAAFQERPSAETMYSLRAVGDGRAAESLIDAIAKIELSKEAAYALSEIVRRIPEQLTTHQLNRICDLEELTYYVDHTYYPDDAVIYARDKIDSVERNLRILAALELSRRNIGHDISRHEQQKNILR